MCNFARQNVCANPQQLAKPSRSSQEIIAAAHNDHCAKLATTWFSSRDHKVLSHSGPQLTCHIRRDLPNTTSSTLCSYLGIVRVLRFRVFPCGKRYRISAEEKDEHRFRKTIETVVASSQLLPSFPRAQNSRLFFLLFQFFVFSMY